MFDIGKRGSGTKLERDNASGSEPDAGQAARLALAGEQAGSDGVSRREAAVIGPSIHIDGTLTGEEDLLIEGRVTGTVQLQDHSLTIGAKGHVEADLYAHTVMVDGEVEGNLYGADRVSIRGSAKVRGNITAPRVSLDDGAWFRGAIEMDPEAVNAALGTKQRSQLPPESPTVQSTLSVTEGGASDTAKADTTGNANDAGKKGRSGKNSGSEQTGQGTGH
ncbi:polymer-forming cytoskeletal protein [Aquisalimonas sp.]|uniref:bactofilin family protein n=1 Tax=Aquisalimonas sp. TaxID=1872621 RepID=UPI0025C532F3|nr:polymer-forming cytoskeletal protein [Aquisalimonas sp.]